MIYKEWRKQRLGELLLTPRCPIPHGQELYVCNTIAGLIDLVKHTGKLNMVVEVGSYSGVSTEVFLLFYGKVIAIDCVYNQNLVDNLIDYPNLDYRIGFSEQVAKEIPNHSVDLVYIDAEHDYNNIKNDILVWLPKIKHGGYISGHDYTELEPAWGVVKAVKETLGYPDKVYQDSSFIKRII